MIFNNFQMGYFYCVDVNKNHGGWIILIAGTGMAAMFMLRIVLAKVKNSVIL